MSAPTRPARILGRRRLARAALALSAAALSSAGACASASALSLSTQGLLGKGQGVTVTVGGESVVGVSAPTTTVGPVKVPEVKVAVGGSSGGAQQVVGVEVGGQPVVQVPAPTLPTTPITGSEVPLSEVPAVVTTTSSVATSPTGLQNTSNSTAPSAGQASTVAAAAPAKPTATTPSPRQLAHGPRSHGKTSGAAGAAQPLANQSASGATPVSAVNVKPARATSSGNPLDILGRHIPFPLPVPDWSKPIILLLALLALLFATRSRFATRRARRLETKRAALQRDVDVMQDALVPPVPGQLSGLAISVAYRPADGPAAGGDFYDVFRPAPGKVAIVLGDVAGHGFRAVKHAALTRYTLRAYLQAGLEPRAAIGLAGRALIDPTGELLATVAVAVYDSERATLTYALAGHPPPIVDGAPSKESVMICCSPPIGWTESTGHRQRTISLPAGAQVCFFSDGLVEARCPSAGRDTLLGRDRLTDILATLGPKPGAENLLGMVGKVASATPDDMAACIITSEGATDIELVDSEELEVDQRALASGRVRELLERCGVGDVAIAQAINQAVSVAGEDQTAVLHIEHAAHAASVSVSPAGEPPLAQINAGEHVAA
jgi:serine phosphatase RsbU (regulator of sigma subunit)